MTKPTLKLEDQVTSETRIKIAREGRTKVFRNNRGAFKDNTGRLVRYGLGNESSRVNKAIKSGDYIGWTNVIITPDMVGKNVPVFTSVEFKKEGWEPNLNDEDENAQRNWADAVTEAGGIARFISDAEQW